MNIHLDCTDQFISSHMLYNIVEPVGTPLRLGVPWPFMGHPADERRRELTWRMC